MKYKLKRMKINRLAFVFVGILLLITAKVLVAQRLVEGYVYNDNSSPIFRATVNVKGSTIQTRTNEAGYFKLEDVPQDATLVFSYLNFKKMEVVPSTAQTVVRLGSSSSEPISGFVNVRKPQDNGDTIFTTVEQTPEFIGGLGELYNYIGNNLKYPEKAVKGKQEGRVFVRFVVEKDGSIGAVELLKGIGLGCDEEAMRVLSEMPKWKPGMQSGQPVRVYYTMPISFRLK